MSMTKRRLPLGLLVGLALTGCGGKAPPVARPKTNLNGPARVQGPARPVAFDNSQGPVAGRPDTDQGKTAVEWGEALKSKNAGKREQASQALRNLGEAGYPQLRDALKDPTPEVRLKAMQAMDLGALRKHQDEMVPLMIALLSDPNPAVREQAAARLVCFDSTGPNQSVQTGLQAAQRLQALQFAALNDPAPNVRLTAATSMQCIQSAMSGRVGTD
jgi:hypothetical protein